MTLPFDLAEVEFLVGAADRIPVSTGADWLQGLMTPEKFHHFGE
jgi:hypothetical protein